MLTVKFIGFSPDTQDGTMLTGHFSKLDGIFRTGWHTITVVNDGKAGAYLALVNADIQRQGYAPISAADMAEMQAGVAAMGWI